MHQCFLVVCKTIIGPNRNNLHLRELQRLGQLLGNETESILDIGAGSAKWHEVNPPPGATHHILQGAGNDKPHLRPEADWAHAALEPATLGTQTRCSNLTAAVKMIPNAQIKTGFIIPPPTVIDDKPNKRINFSLMQKDD